MEEAIATPLDEMKDIPAEFHSAVRKHGREIYTQLMVMGMAGGATAVLEQLVHKHQSQHSANALMIMVKAVNTLAAGLVEAKGWTPEQLAACDADLRAAAPRIVPASPLIVKH